MTAHAVLGASSADRWMNCPGSIRMSRGLPDSPSEHAAEGTAAHELAEKCLTNGHASAEFYRGEIIPVDDYSFEVDDDMIEAVDVYLAEIQKIRDEAPDLEEWVERRFSLEALQPPQPMFGTGDWVAYSRALRRLWVRDYKHGRGKVVQLRGNPQLRYYGLGALLSLPLDLPVREVDLGIVQPRAGNIGGEVIAAEELLDFAGELMAAAKLVDTPDAHLTPGDWCRWCRAKAVCPALKGQALAVAQAEFGQPPAPHTLTPEQVAYVLERADVVEEWVAAVRKFALAEAELGRAPPGFKLVHKRATRKWAADDDAVAERLALETGLEFHEFFERKVVSPAQAEKLLKPLKKKLPDGLANAVSSGYSLAPESDKRPAVNLLSAADEFDTLPNQKET